MNRYGKRITTLETLAPKLIDAEFEKHRMLSSNSSSSRALPFSVDWDPYIPSDIRKAEKGMQGYANIDPDMASLLEGFLKRLYYNAASQLEKWKEEIHKQHLNWYTDPWAWQQKVVTATEWDNFFDLRMAGDARPEIKILAYAMKVAMDESLPVQRDHHIPYVSDLDQDKLSLGELRMVSAGRAANISFRTPEREMMDAYRARVLADRLVTDKHMTPFEHQAQSMAYMDDDRVWGWEEGVSHMDWGGQLWSGNFHGWVQYRKILEQRS